MAEVATSLLDNGAQLVAAQPCFQANLLENLPQLLVAGRAVRVEVEPHSPREENRVLRNHREVPSEISARRKGRGSVQAVKLDGAIAAHVDEPKQCKRECALPRAGPANHTNLRSSRNRERNVLQRERQRWGIAHANISKSEFSAKFTFRRRRRLLLTSSTFLSGSAVFLRHFLYKLSDIFQARNLNIHIAEINDHQIRKNTQRRDNSQRNHHP